MGGGGGLISSVFKQVVVDAVGRSITRSGGEIGRVYGRSQKDFKRGVRKVNPVTGAVHRGHKDERKAEVAQTAARVKAEDRINAERELTYSKLKRSKSRLGAGAGGNRGGTIATSSSGVQLGDASGQEKLGY